MNSESQRQHQSVDHSHRRRWPTVFRLLVLALGLALAAVPLATTTARADDTRTVLTFYAFPDEPYQAFSNRGVQIDLGIVWPDPAPVAPDPTGTGQVILEGALFLTFDMADIGGFQFTFPAKPPGLYHFDVSYGGDGYYQPVTQHFSYRVLSGPATQTTLTSTASGTVPVGTEVTFTAHTSTLDGQPICGLDFSDNSCTPQEAVTYYDTSPTGEVVQLGDEETGAPLTISTLAVGTHTITAVFDFRGYVGGYSPSTSNAITLVVVAPQYSVRAYLTAAPRVVTFGRQITAWAVVTPDRRHRPCPTGYVRFYDGSTAVGSPVKLQHGGAKYVYSAALARGRHTLQAKYLGDGNYRPQSTNTTVVLVK